jgi:hypothetical protein
MAAPVMAKPTFRTNLMPSDWKKIPLDRKLQDVNILSTTLLPLGCNLEFHSNRSSA